MSSGDIDDTMATDQELDAILRSNRALATYLNTAKDLPIDRGYDIPFAAGISTDGKRRYIDRHLHTRFQGVDIASALAEHESAEWALRRFAGIGLDYSKDPKGHELANRAEFRQLQRIFPNANWQAYSNFIDPQVKRDEKENIERPPADLALYPYVGAMRKHLIKKGVKDEERTQPKGPGDDDTRHTSGGPGTPPTPPAGGPPRRPLNSPARPRRKGER